MTEAHYKKKTGKRTRENGDGGETGNKEIVEKEKYFGDCIKKIQKIHPVMVILLGYKKNRALKL